MLCGIAEPDTGSMTNTWTTPPQQWQPPMPYADHFAARARRRCSPLVVLARVLGAVASGPLVLVGAILGAAVLHGPGALVGGGATALGLGAALGATHDDRSRISASVAYAIAGAVLALTLGVVILLVALSQIHGEVF